jgi:hypothetical protein
MQVPNCVAHPSRTQVQKGRPTDEGQAEGRIPDMDKWRRDQFGFVPMTLEQPMVTMVTFYLAE